MNLCDLKIGDAITVKASHGLDCIEFQSTIAGSVNGIAVMDPVISSSKPVNFVSDFVKRFIFINFLYNTLVFSDTLCVKNAMCIEAFSFS